MSTNKKKASTRLRSVPVGVLERLDRGNAVGWALNPTNLKEHLSVEILEGNKALAVGIANLPHDALLARGVGSGEYGFSIPLPLSTEPDASITARVAGSDVYLNNNLLTKGIPHSITSIGNIDGIFQGIAFGWVSGQDNTPPVLIAKIDEDITVPVTLLNRRADIEALGLATFAFSFMVDLRSFNPEKNNVVDIKVKKGEFEQSLPNSPFSLTAVTLWGHCETLIGPEIRGWCIPSGTADDGPVLVELWIDGVCVAQKLASDTGPDLSLFGLYFIKCGFKFQIPAPYLDGNSHEIKIQPHNSFFDIRLGNAVQTFCFTLESQILYANSDRVIGWAYIRERPSAKLCLELREEGYVVGSGIANQVVDLPLGHPLKRSGTPKLPDAGFHIVFAGRFDIQKVSRTLSLHLPGDTHSVDGQQILLESRSRLIELAQLQGRKFETLRWWMRELIEILQRSEAHDDTLFKIVPEQRAIGSSFPVDIIVPVYKGRDETLECLNRLFAMNDPTPRNIVVINDASPDTELVKDLYKMADQGQPLILIDNHENLGFVASVNRGMLLHRNHDVLLLNADTVVPKGDWLKRIQDAAYRDEKTATATPFSNRATICSLPLPDVDNEIPSGHTVDSIDNLCRELNSLQTADIPTAIGFCMYIKRAALDEVGLFDYETWGKGYGEENDFCVKASNIGWRHVAVCDVFVEHKGSVSFSTAKSELIAKNLRILNERYPQYSTFIRRHRREDPLSSLRNRVALELFPPKHRRRKQTLHITHNWGGGVGLHVSKLCVEDGYCLRPLDSEQVELFQPSSGFRLMFPVADLENLPPFYSETSFTALLKKLNISSVHIHQWIGLPPSVWNISKALGVPLDFTVHDYYVFCPRITMIDGDDAFCNQAPISRCGKCLESDPPLQREVATAYQELGGLPQTWRRFHLEHLRGARKIIAPCQDTKKRIVSAFDITSILVQPHEAPLRPAPLFRTLPSAGERMRVAVIGAIGPHKGYTALLKLIQLADIEEPDLLFFIVGTTKDDTPFKSCKNVHITGVYKPHDLQEMLRKLDCHVALFLSQWPETYSYTLSEALLAGLTPVVPAIGAMGERVTSLGAGLLLATPITPDDILRNLRSLYRN